MNSLQGLLYGLSVAATPVNLLAAFVGAFAGTAIGVLPGLGPVAGVALILPLTFSLDPTAGLIMMAGIFYGSMYGGSTTAILLNIPGESASVVTAIDGYQLARKGRAGATLTIVAVGSFVGGTLAVVGVTTMIVSAGMVGTLVKRFGERATLFLGLFLGGLGFALFGASPTGWLFVAAIPVNALWGLAAPPLQTLMTRRVSVTEQGELQGAVASLRGIAMIVGPGVFAAVFAYFIVPGRFIPGAPWFLSALLLLAALLLAWVVAPKAVTRDEKEPSSPVTTVA